MNVRTVGDPKLPILVCVPGLMGDVSDFDFFLDQWKFHFHVLLPSLTDVKEATEVSFTEVTESGDKRLVYESSPHLLALYLKSKFPGQRVFFAGISLGGKITIEIAGRYPEIFAGAVLTDVGFGPLCQSPLFDFVHDIIPNLPIGEKWPKLRAQLTEKIPDKMLRLLVQSHIEVQSPEHPVTSWRKSSLDFPELVQGTALEDQWDLQDRVERPIHILKATVASGIRDQDIDRLEQSPQVKVHVIEGANHFIQVYRRDIFAQAPIDYLGGLDA